MPLATRWHSWQNGGGPAPPGPWPKLGPAPADTLRAIRNVMEGRLQTRVRAEQGAEIEGVRPADEAALLAHSRDGTGKVKLPGGQTGLLALARGYEGFNYSLLIYRDSGPEETTGQFGDGG